MTDNDIIIILDEPRRGTGKTDMSAHLHKQFTENTHE